MKRNNSLRDDSPGVTFGNGCPGSDGGCSSSGDRSDAYPWSCGSPLISLLSFRSGHLPNCWRCFSSSQLGLCITFISRSSSSSSMWTATLAVAVFATHGCENDEFEPRLLQLLFLASCLRFGSVPTKSRSEFRWHLSSKKTLRPYRLPESTSTVSALRFLFTASKLPWRQRTRSRSLCWYLERTSGSLILYQKEKSLWRGRNRRELSRLEDRERNVRQARSRDVKTCMRRHRSIDRSTAIPLGCFQDSPNCRVSSQRDVTGSRARAKGDEFEEFIEGDINPDMS